MRRAERRAHNLMGEHPGLGDQHMRKHRNGSQMLWVAGAQGLFVSFEFSFKIDQKPYEPQNETMH